MKEISHKQRLREIYNKNTTAFTGSFVNEETLAKMAELLQVEYPGNYTVKETYLPERMQWD